MQRIVIDGVIFGLQKAGGISRMWADTLLGLDEDYAKKNLVTLLLPQNQNVEWEEISAHLSHIKIFPRRRFKWNKRGFFRESLYLTWICWQLRPTIWHSSYYVGFPMRFCPHRIVSFYDMIGERFGEGTQYDSKMKYRTLQAANTIVAISEHSRKDLISFWPHMQSNTYVIHLCARKEKSNEIESSHFVPSPYLLFVGRREGYKNFSNLIKYLLVDSRFKEYHIVVVGGKEGFSTEEQKILIAASAQKKVHYLGVVLPSEIEKLARQAAAILYPSIYEGFGLPLLEAFSYGIPVLACRCSSIPEIVGPEYPLADPTNPSTFPDILAKLLANKEKWITYGKKRIKLFTRDKMIRAILDIYEA